MCFNYEPVKKQHPHVVEILGETSNHSWEYLHESWWHGFCYDNSILIRSDGVIFYEVLDWSTIDGNCFLSNETLECLLECNCNHNHQHY